jgi:hypothetical protein
MAVNWKQVRYRGDAADVADLMTEYRVNDFLGVVEENRRRIDQGLRERLVKDGIRLSEALSPRVFRIFNNLCRSLGLSTEPEIFCLPSQDVNAFAVLETRQNATYSLIGVTAGALEKLSDTELLSILAHELGHFIFENHRLSGLLNTNPDSQDVTVLPAFGEALFLRWQKKAEISADRVSVLATGDFHATASALLKSTFGLSERNLNLDVSALMAQIDEIKGHPELMSEAFASHPVLPIRLKAAQLFAGSTKATTNGFPAGANLLEDATLEDEVDALLALTRRYPFRKVDLAVMRAVALGGVKLLAADREPSDDEVKVLVHVLHQYFTDEPEKEIETDPAAIDRELPRALEVINAEGDEGAKVFVLSRLADIALADGAVLDPESEFLLQVAAGLQVPPKNAYGILIGAAQSVGFRVDAKLNRMAADIRKGIVKGLG